MIVRRALAADATDTAALLRESITVLCVADHQNDAATLNHWLSNKTSSRIEQLIVNPDHVAVIAEVAIDATMVAEREQRLLGVGLVTSKGEMQLCYLRPGATRGGVGRAILLALEEATAAAGIGRIFLTSTSRARAFYERAGYVATGPGRALFGTVVGYPYEKAL